MSTTAIEQSALGLPEQERAHWVHLLLDKSILERDFAQQMAAMFALDQAASTLIDPQTWADRPLAFKLKEWLTRLWERWL